MGYSIYVAAPDKATMEEMYEFLSREYKPFLMGKDQAYGSLARGKEGDYSLSYVLNEVEFPVGFDYSVMAGTERIFMFAVVNWMARTLHNTGETNGHRGFPATDPEYFYDIEDKFSAKEDPIDVEYLVKKLKKDPVVEREDILDIAQDMYWDLIALDVAWKARSGVADPLDFWEEIERQNEWWEIYQEDKESDAPVPFASEMTEFIRRGPLAQVKKWFNLAVDTCPDIDEIGHWLEHLIAEATEKYGYNDRSATNVRAKRRQEALFTLLEERGIE